MMIQEIENGLLVSNVSMLTATSRTMTLNVTMSQYLDWKQGALIQNAMPNLSADEREFVMTGVTAQEWSDEFGTDGQRNEHKGKAGTL